MASSLFQELKRRNVYKVGVAYLVLAWVVVQVTSAAVPALHLPEWINSAVFLFGAMGFPFALFFAWEFELTPDGVKRESEITPEDSISAHTGRKLDFIIIGLMAVALGYFIYESRFTSTVTKVVVAEKNSTLEKSSPKKDIEHEGASIAVLPFVNMSSDPEQEFFSDGISEEILNVLVRLPKLKVAGRTSSFSFKNSNDDIPTIAQKLNVNHVLEGSIRKSGSTLRITAQLIRKDGFHLWSETYDRELADIFEIQDDISKSISEALSISLGIEHKSLPATHRTQSPAAYQAYLKARQAYSKRGLALKEAVLNLNKALLYAPNFVPAWSLLAKTYSIYPYHAVEYDDKNWQEYLPLAMKAVDKALALDPQSAQALVALGNIYKEQHDYLLADETYRKAIKLTPNDADARQQYGEVLIILGHTKRAIEQNQLANELDSNVPQIINNLAWSSNADHQFEKAIELIDQALAIDPSLKTLINNKILALLSLRKFDELKELINKVLSTRGLSPEDAERIRSDYFTILDDPLLKTDNDKLLKLSLILSGESKFPLESYAMNTVELIEKINGQSQYKQIDIVNFLSTELWSEPRIKSIIKSLNILKAWQKLGFPDYCTPVGKDDFTCQRDSFAR